MRKIACLICFCLFSHGVLRAEEIGHGDESVKKNTTGSSEKQNRAKSKNMDEAMKWFDKRMIRKCWKKSDEK